MTIKKNDIVASRGRIKTVQNDTTRYISFDEGLVLEVTEDGITVNPLGMQAVLLCQPDDLLEPGEVSSEGYVQSAKEQAEAAKPAPAPEPEEVGKTLSQSPEGSVAVSGEVAEEAATEEPKPSTRPRPTKDSGIAAARATRRRRDR